MMLLIVILVVFGALREAMRLRVMRAAYHLEDGLTPRGLLGPYTEEQAEFVRDLLADLHAVADWLDAQPDERWEPVRELQSLRCPVQEDEPGDWSIDVSAADDLLVMEADVTLPGDTTPVRVRLAAELPADLRLCRRVEVSE